MSRRNTKSRRSSAKSASLSARSRVVWIALIFSMTAVAGGLMVIDRGGAPVVGGSASLPPMLAQGSVPGSMEAIFRTRQPLQPGRWKAIVIHHTADPVGSPTSVAADHQKQGILRVGHHFIIGNGAGMEDGELWVGGRWQDQVPGAHAVGERGDWYNNNAISICLVGNGNRRTFTVQQVARLQQLVTTLCRDLKIDPSRVVLHSEIAPQVSDPGRLFPDADTFRRRIADGL